MMRRMKTPVAVIAALALITVMLISSVEIAAYGDFDFFRREYEKYDVLDDVDMEMDDLMYVTREMMAYLRGDREVLSVETTVGGQTVDFFNEQDRFHMWEVQKLFIGGMQLRAICTAITVVAVLLLAALRVNLKQLLPKVFLWTTGILMAAVLVIGIWAAVDFNTVFTYFHLIFFDNDLWLFDPATDLMINVLVEGFFMDIALKIVLIFAGMMAAVTALCAFVLRIGKKEKKNSAVKAAAFLLAAAVAVQGLMPLKAEATGETVESPVEEFKTEHVDHEFEFPSDWPEAPEINAGAAILYEATTGTVLYAKNADVELYPASITKVMTGLLVAEYGRMSDIVTYSYDAIYTNLEYGAMTMGISVDEQISVKDSFYGMMLQSANDAANGLAEYVAGSNEAFAVLMNQRAKEIGAYNTNFSNPSGLFGADHYTTCYDMALIMAEAVKNPTFRTVASTSVHIIDPTNKMAEIRKPISQHKMKSGSAYEYEGFVCGKTGWVEQSGNTLVTVCERDNMQLIAVVMMDTNPAHYQDTILLMDYGFDNFKLCQVEGSLLTGEKDGDYLSGSEGLFEQAGFSIEENYDSMLLLPQTAELSDVECALDYDVENTEENGNIIADIIYSYHGMVVGTGTLEFVPTEESLSDPKDIEESIAAEETAEETEGSTEEEPKAREIIITVAQVMLFIAIILAVVVIVIVLAVYFNPSRTRARRARRRRKARMKKYKMPDDFL